MVSRNTQDIRQMMQAADDERQKSMVPCCGHIFIALEDTRVVDPTDNYKISSD
jgi:hypothetical protein